MMMQTELIDFFLNTDMLGYLGPLALVAAGFFLGMKNKGLGLIVFVIDCLCAAQYFELIDTTPSYWWQIFILLIGGVLVLIPTLMRR